MGFGFDGQRNDVNSEAMVQGSVSVGTSSVEAKASTSALEGREQVRVYNKGPYTIYWGPSGVTTSTGEPIYVDQWIDLPYSDTVPVYLVSGTASSSAIVTESK